MAELDLTTLGTDNKIGTHSGEFYKRNQGVQSVLDQYPKAPERRISSRTYSEQQREGSWKTLKMNSVQLTSILPPFPRKSKLSFKPYEPP